MKNFINFELKAALLVEGIAVEQPAMEGVGADFKEQNHGLFGWDFKNHQGIAFPDDFTLSDGTVVQFRYNPDSPYKMVKQNGTRSIVKGEAQLDAITLIPRPLYYDKQTRNGVTMRKIAQIGGEDCFFICYNNYCSHFSKKTECAFCNLVSTQKAYNSVVTKKKIDDMVETAVAAFAEGNYNHILLTGGCSSKQKEIDVVTNIVEGIRDALRTDRVPGTVLPSATIDEKHIRRYHETGIGAIGYSMEIWDEAFYRAICPGKARSTSHDTYFDAIKIAVKIFGAGNVYAVFVMGLEPRDKLLEGIQALYDIGANVVPFVWSPNPGSRFEGHRAPFAKWYTETTMQAAEVVVKSGVPLGDENHCYRCDGNSLLHDAVRLLRNNPSDHDCGQA